MDKRGLIYDLLPEGEAHAISKTALMRITGLSDRELRRKVHAERRSGFLILTNCVTGGLYRPSSTDQTVKFIRSMRRRAAETAAVADAVELALEAEVGQGRMEGF